VVTDVEYRVGWRVDRRLVEDADDAFGDVVNVGEVGCILPWLKTSIGLPARIACVKLK